MLNVNVQHLRKHKIPKLHFGFKDKVLSFIQQMFTVYPLGTRQ